MIDWQQAALRVGEELASSGPEGYYSFTADQWRDWCLAALVSSASSRRVETETPQDVLWSINVFREADGRWAADWLTPDGNEAGMSDYSTTPIGALANLTATLIKVEEDRAIERRRAQPGGTLGTPASTPDTGGGSLGKVGE